MKRIKVKPSKSQSLIAFIVGICFCIIGVVIAIPTSGIFGIIWTTIAGFITISHGINLFGKKGVHTYEVNIEDNNDIDDRLRKLDSLYNQGLINKEEYDKKRQDILNDI